MFFQAVAAAESKRPVGWALMALLGSGRTLSHPKLCDMGRMAVDMFDRSM